MKLSQRSFLASMILAVEVITVFIPGIAIYVAYLLIARPSWFKD